MIRYCRGLKFFANFLFKINQWHRFKYMSQCGLSVPSGPVTCLRIFFCLLSVLMENRVTVMEPENWGHILTLTMGLLLVCSYWFCVLVIYSSSLMHGTAPFTLQNQ